MQGARYKGDIALAGSPSHQWSPSPEARWGLQQAGWHCRGFADRHAAKLQQLARMPGT